MLGVPRHFVTGKKDSQFFKRVFILGVGSNDVTPGFSAMGTVFRRCPGFGSHQLEGRSQAANYVAGPPKFLQLLKLQKPNKQSQHTGKLSGVQKRNTDKNAALTTAGPGGTSSEPTKKILKTGALPFRNEMSGRPTHPKNRQRSPRTPIAWPRGKDACKLQKPFHL